MIAHITYPNDYQSDKVWDEMYEEHPELKDMDADQLREWVNDGISEPAMEAGLIYIGSVDHGSFWSGRREKIEIAKEKLPFWATLTIFE
jgi:hypothetical protein